MKSKEELIEIMARALRDNAVEVHKQIGDMERMLLFKRMILQAR